ncbi:hypothetical protein ILYODFUR_009422 [Ilyodon furcidens]|uniref:Uncharacterized protein n=1 Tax=Ilyodon furcidens TaxID=33524 RepID=A0ABV0SJT1_9TELE
MHSNRFFFFFQDFPVLNFIHLFINFPFPVEQNHSFSMIWPPPCLTVRQCVQGDVQKLNVLNLHAKCWSPGLDKLKCAWLFLLCVSALSCDSLSRANPTSCPPGSL